MQDAEAFTDLHLRLQHQYTDLHQEYSDLREDFETLERKHQNFVSDAIPATVVKALKEQVDKLTGKLECMTAKCHQDFSADAIKMRVENNKLMQVSSTMYQKHVLHHQCNVTLFLFFPVCVGLLQAGISKFLSMLFQP